MLNNNDINNVMSYFKEKKDDLTIDVDEKKVPIIKSPNYYYYIFREGTFISTFLRVYNNDTKKVDDAILKLINGDDDYKNILNDLFSYFRKQGKTIIKNVNDGIIFQRNIKK